MVVGITFGTFDLLYSGYIEMLKQAKTKCDYLIVGLHTDPSIERPYKNEPIQSVFERYKELLDCSYVDEIITYTTEQELVEILARVKVDIRIIGEEYKNTNFTGKHFCITNGIAIYYNPRVHTLQSLFLINRPKEKARIKKYRYIQLGYFHKILNGGNSLNSMLSFKERPFSLN